MDEPRIVGKPDQRSLEVLERIEKHESPGSAIAKAVAAEWPLVFEKGQGAILTDLTGNSYIDFTSGGVACTNIGHCHPKVVEAIKRQAEKMIFVHGGSPTSLRAQLLEMIVNIVPFRPSRIHFGLPGTESIEIAMKLARSYTHKTEIITFHRGFHGRSFGSLSLTPYNDFRRGLLPMLPGAIPIPYAYCYRCVYGLTYPDCGLRCVRYLEYLLKDNYTGVTEPGAIVLEPIQGVGGIIIPPDEFLKEIRSICNEYGLLLIADEIQSGFGRTGKMFGFENWDVVPDMMAIGKGIASGVPMSALVAKEEIMNVWEGKPFMHGSTFAPPPLAMAAAIATIEVIKEGRLVERSAELGRYLLNALRDSLEKYELVGDIRGKGLMIGIELVNEKKIPAAQETIEVIQRSLSQGLFIGRAGVPNVLRVTPPLIIEKSQIDRSLEILDDAFSRVEHSHL